MLSLAPLSHSPLRREEALLKFEILLTPFPFLDPQPFKHSRSSCPANH